MGSSSLLVTVDSEESYWVCDDDENCNAAGHGASNVPRAVGRD